jgi:hypothetical protein
MFIRRWPVLKPYGVPLIQIDRPMMEAVEQDDASWGSHAYSTVENTRAPGNRRRLWSRLLAQGLISVMLVQIRG